MVVNAAAVEAFQRQLINSQRLCLLTGAGVSAESGIPTFRGAGGLWRTHAAQELATPQAFVRDPSLVWQFYHWRRQVVASCKPNRAHIAIAQLQAARFCVGKQTSLITQNIDRLHQAAGSTDVIELHGSLWDVCVARKDGLKDRRYPIWEDRRQPLVPALDGMGNPAEAHSPAIPVEQLPRTEDGSCLLRPAVTWFGEQLEEHALTAAQQAVATADLLITIGTSSAVYPAAGFAADAAARGVSVAEVNLETSGATDICQYVFQGKAGELLPLLFGPVIQAPSAAA